MKTIFISGAGSGIGLALAEAYIRQGESVFAVGRHEPKSLLSHPNLTFVPLDLEDADLVRDSLRPFIQGRTFDQVILNAGIYPDMQSMVDITLEELRRTIDLNAWAHKHTIDALLSHTKTRQIVALSASPSFFHRKGMGTFALSKTILNTLIQLYAEEFPHVHFSALAPVLIQTPTFSAFLQSENSRRYPVIQEIRDSIIYPADQGAAKLIDAMEEIKRLKSGSFVEMKKLGLGYY